MTKNNIKAQGTSAAGDGPGGDGKDFSDLQNEHFRLTCISLLEELDYDLGEEYLQKYYKLKQMAAKVEAPQDRLKLRERLLDLVRYFANAVFEEKEAASGFIAEVVTRLAEVESYLYKTVENTVTLQRSREQFTEGLVADIDCMSDSVRKSADLNSLRSLVLVKLDNLKNNIEEQRKLEREQVRDIKHQLDTMKSVFDSMQKKVCCLEDENQDLAKKIRIDPLTGCANRLGLDERFADEMARLDRYARTFSLALVDVDHFKDVNDTFGHQVGDNCLREIARKLGTGLRQSDFLSRFGGEEFVLLLPETDLHRAVKVAEKQRSLIQKTNFQVKGHKVPVTVSMGVTEIRKEDTGLASALRRADKAMYRAKQAGRNKVELG